MDITKQTVIETLLDATRKARTLWENSFSKTDDVHWALSKVLDELEKYTADYKPWSWALEQLVAGKCVKWKHWGRDSFIRLKGQYLERYSVLEGDEMHMGRFETSIDKYLEDGWILYEPRA